MYTIVSAYPEEVNENKITLMPSEYRIPAAKKGDFEVLHVDHAVTFRYIDEARGTDRRPVFDKEVATAICHDFINAKIEIDANAGPALFALEGQLSKEDILRNHKDKLNNAIARQEIWFKRLVDRADDDWNKYKRHSAITNIQRKAAIHLGLGHKEWAQELSQMAIKNCKFCGTPVRPEIIVCPQCRSILDKDAYMKMGGSPIDVPATVQNQEATKQLATGK